MPAVAAEHRVLVEVAAVIPAREGEVALDAAVAERRLVRALHGRASRGVGVAPDDRVAHVRGPDVDRGRPAGAVAGDGAVLDQHAIRAPVQDRTGEGDAVVADEHAAADDDALGTPREDAAAAVVGDVVLEEAVLYDRATAVTDEHGPAPAGGDVVDQVTVADDGAAVGDAHPAAVERVSDRADLRGAAADGEAVDHRGVRLAALDQEPPLRVAEAALAAKDRVLGTLLALDGEVLDAEVDVAVAVTLVDACGDPDDVPVHCRVDRSLDGGELGGDEQGVVGGGRGSKRERDQKGSHGSRGSVGDEGKSP